MTIDITTVGLIAHWDLVVVDLLERFNINLHDRDVLARPWPHVRGFVLALLTSESHLREALTRR